MSDDEFSTKESQFDDSASVLSEAMPRTNQPRRTTNTGPKGVRADARAYEASKREATVMKKIKNGFLNRNSKIVSGGESGSDADEDKWMTRWREQRMKELSKIGVAGVNLFGQVDDVDARGYLAVVDYEDSDTADDSKRMRARRNVVAVVLIYDNVFTYLCLLISSLPIPRRYFSYSLRLLGDIQRHIFCACRLTRPRICRRIHSQQS